MNQTPDSQAVRVPVGAWDPARPVLARILADMEAFDAPTAGIRGTALVVHTTDLFDTSTTPSGFTPRGAGMYERPGSVQALLEEQIGDVEMLLLALTQTVARYDLPVVTTIPDHDLHPQKTEPRPVTLRVTVRPEGSLSVGITMPISFFDLDSNDDGLSADVDS